uniref:PID domain-containing protein n=1 Tax=Esox lucius TaxID=8010 RepID=A0AAY5KEW5_ESOLU
MSNIFPTFSGTSVTNPPCDVTCRFQGDGVRYKAKLIGMDFVPVAQGEKTCLDSMMKLKGQEVAARNQGRHKQRVWLKVTAAAVTILDERTGVRHHIAATENKPKYLASYVR